MDLPKYVLKHDMCVGGGTDETNPAVIEDDA